jgi:threonine dehydrogenase-like Zn-dependent dehydrogenase
MSLVITRELRLVGLLQFRDEIDGVVAALADGRLTVDPVIAQEHDVTDAPETFAVARGAARSWKALLRF